MELKEFVKNTILDIMDGIKDAQSQDKTGATIGYFSHMSANIEFVEFDVALETIEDKEHNRGIAVSFPTLVDTGLFGKKKSRSSESTRIKFRVPVNYPIK